MLRRLKLIDVVILITLSSTFFYILANNMPRGIGSFRFLWGPVAIVVILFSTPVLIKLRQLRLVIYYGLFIVFLLQIALWKFMSDWNRNSIIEEFYSILVFGLIWLYYYYKKSFSELLIISRWCLIFIVITLVTTNYALTIFPTIVRESAAGFRGNLVLLRFADVTGVAKYGYAQAFVLFIPFFVYLLKNKLNLLFKRRTTYIILFLFMVTIIRAQVFANVLVMVVALVFALLGPSRKNLLYRYFIIFIVLYFMIPNSFYISSLRYIGSYFGQETEMYYKLNDFAMFIENPELDTTTGAGGRAERYPILFKAFLASPFVGDASYNSKHFIEPGGHIHWMNRLTLWGIFGFIFFIYVLIALYKSVVICLPNKEIVFYYSLSVLSYVLLGVMKNLAGRESWAVLLVILPGLYIGLSTEAHNKLISVKNKEKSNV